MEIPLKLIMSSGNRVDFLGGRVDFSGGRVDFSGGREDFLGDRRSTIFEFSHVKGRN